MDIQYKPSKPKKEKPVKAPKAPKAEKAVKLAPATVKASKPAKAPKQPKVPKAEKNLEFKPSAKLGKVEKSDKFQKSGVLQKSISPKVAVGIVLALIVIAVVVIAVAVPAAQKTGMEIASIEITRQPDKLVYLEGEKPNYDGLRVTVTRKNGETFVVRANDCEITGFSSDIAVESRIITVSYEGFSEFFSVEIKENEKPDPVLKSIRLDPMPKTEYKVGEWLNTDGAYLVREYVDGSTVKVNLLKTDVYGWDKVNGPGTYELTVKYAENGVLCTYKYTITVTE